MSEKEAIQKRIIVDLYTEFRTLRKNDILDKFSEDISLKKTKIIKCQEEIINDLKLIKSFFPPSFFIGRTRKEKYVDGIICASILCQIFGIENYNFNSFQKEMLEGGINIDLSEDILFQINQYYFIFKNSWDIKIAQEYNGLIETFLLNPLKRKINELLKNITFKNSSKQKRAYPFRIGFQFSFDKSKKSKFY